jgi:hypothetical protein
LGQIAPEFEGGFFTVDTNINRAWRSVAYSADGTRLVAVDNPGGGTNGLIYISGLIKPPLNLVHITNNLAVVWPYPLTGWTLQQNSNLTKATWSPASGVTNNGHVNYIIFPPTGKMFFRLQQQP